MIMDSVGAVHEPAAAYKFRAKTEEEKVTFCFNKIVDTDALKNSEYNDWLIGY